MHDVPSMMPVEQLGGVEALAQIKAARHETSRHEGELVELGALKNELNAHLWNKEGISLERRLISGEVTEAELEAVSPALEESFVPTQEGANKRCIDGSTGEGYDDTDPNSYGRGLGPQIQGGTAGEAVAWRMATGVPKGQTGVTIVDDILRTAQQRPSKFKEGGHDDDHAGDYSQKTGCGQIDGGPRKQPRYGDPEVAAEYRGVADHILTQYAGITPPVRGFEHLQQSAAVLADEPQYFAAPSNIVAAFRQVNPTGVETVIRPHNEVTLTINLVPNTTFHRDEYNARTDSKIQNFNLDAWNIVEEHDALTAYALIVDAVATFMDLTDGSIRVLVRVPRASTPAEPSTA